MREILFRGKTESGRWIEGYYLKVYDEYPVIDYYTKDNSYRSPVITETVTQYTGYKDSEDMNIFEGDIIEWYPKNGNGIAKEPEKGVVKFGQYDENSYGFYIEWINDNFFREDFLYWINQKRDVKVIGNIFDNHFSKN